MSQTQCVRCLMGKERQLPAIEVEGLYKVYHHLVVVEDVSFTTYRGEAFGFLGPNGAGKSTIVKIITGLVSKIQGTVRVLGYPVNGFAMLFC
jgi:ABC-type multidrug transport system ATPase subunit